MKDRRLVDFVMHPIKKQGLDDISEDNTNIIKPLIFRLFPKLTQLTISTSTEDNIYAFNLRSFLSVLSDAEIPERFETFQIVDDEVDKSGGWLKSVLCEDIEKEFAAKGWSIKLETYADEDLL